MVRSKADIIAQLQKDILPLQGFKTAGRYVPKVDLGIINHVFPNNTFPTGTIHEFISYGKEDSVASAGFVAGIMGMLMKGGGITAWITMVPVLYPPALISFNINPANILMIKVSKEKDLLWTAEEVLKCEGLAAVVLEMRELDFNTSRRLQLIVERSRVTGFILREQPRRLITTASIARWQITSAGSILTEKDMPGVGHPAWKVELLKLRNGKPGSWKLYWSNKKFQLVKHHETQMITEEKRKAG